MSEKVGMPNPEPGDGYFVAAGRGFFFRMLNSTKIKPGEADKFFNEEEEIGVRRKE